MARLYHCNRRAEARKFVALCRAFWVERQACFEYEKTIILRSRPLQTPPKPSLKPSQIDPKSPKRRPRGAQETPKRSKRRPRDAQERPRDAHEASKRRPRAPKTAHEAPQPPEIRPKTRKTRCRKGGCFWTCLFSLFQIGFRGVFPWFLRGEIDPKRENVVLSKSLKIVIFLKENQYFQGFDACNKQKKHRKNCKNRILGRTSFCAPFGGDFGMVFGDQNL